MKQRGPHPGLLGLSGVWLGAAGLIYLGLPYLLVQLLGLGLAREGTRRHYDLALTFDDGPDPLTTPAVLDALKAAGAHATFFVVGSRAAGQPELIARMLAEGHQVELHAVKHRHAWLRTPWSAFLEPSRGAAQLTRLTGKRPRYHRPPHGAYSLATVLGQRWAGLTGAHWTVEARDWHPAFSPQRTAERLLSLTYPGAVVVMHDAGPGAATTVKALPGVLADLGERGYTFRTLDELPGLAPLNRAGLPRRVSRLADALFDRLNHLGPVMQRADSAFRTGVSAFPLEAVTLRNGQVVDRGTRVLELHVNSAHMVDFGVKRGMRRAINWDLPWLAEEISRRPEWRSAEAVYTLGSLASLAAMFGFETRDLPLSQARRLSRWVNWLRRSYGTREAAPSVKLSIIGMDAFLERYLGKGKDQPEGGKAPPNSSGHQTKTPALGEDLVGAPRRT